MSDFLRSRGWISFILIWSLAGIAQGQPPPQPLPPPLVPPENPITEPKRVLGKMLFWDEQLSSDNTISCGTCHRPGRGGADPRIARHPGNDSLLNTPDDVFGSPGVIRSDASNRFLRDPVFGLLPQITPRAANPAITAMYAPDLFWDGRARTTFLNPETGVVSIATGGALESQAVGPILSSVEMAHDGRTWSQVIQKLSIIEPMILASNLPADVSEALENQPSYPDLFEAAFGDPAITAERIGFAIATYERTLVPNQTPWDRFIAGDAGAMTPGQVQGWNTLRASPCVICHAPPLFSDNTFQNLGLRPVPEDRGRQNVTGLPGDRGRFKTPTLRNVGLKPTFMHTGVFTALNQVIAFYANGAAQFPDNKSPLLPIALPPPAVPAVIDFMANGLTDPRVAAETFPFDRPTLHTERPQPNPSLLGGAVPGSNGIVPLMIAVSPPNRWNIDFKIGVTAAPGGAEAFVAFSTVPPVGGQLINPMLHGPMQLSGVGPGNGVGTWQWPIDQAAVENCDVYLQWLVTDPAAAGGIARSRIAHLRMIPYLCTGDMNCDGKTDALDIQAMVLALMDPAAYGASYPDCNPAHGDLNGDNLLNLVDVGLFTQEVVGLP